MSFVSLSLQTSQTMYVRHKPFHEDTFVYQLCKHMNTYVYYNCDCVIFGPIVKVSCWRDCCYVKICIIHCFEDLDNIQFMTVFLTLFINSTYVVWEVCHYTLMNCLWLTNRKDLCKLVLKHTVTTLIIHLHMYYMHTSVWSVQYRKSSIMD